MYTVNLAPPRLANAIVVVSQINLIQFNLHQVTFNAYPTEWECR